jgi:hypothetical protein
MYLQPFLKSVLDAADWCGSLRGCLTLWEEIPNTHSVGCWLEARAGMYTFGEAESLSSLLGMESCTVQVIS